MIKYKYPDAGQGAVCDLCVRSARPSASFSRHSSSTSSSAPQSVDSGLQVPSGPLVVSGAATSLATESVESGVVEPSASVAESSTAATGPATGSHQIDYCRTALVADQSLLHTHPAHLALHRTVPSELVCPSLNWWDTGGAGTEDLTRWCYFWNTTSAIWRCIHRRYGIFFSGSLCQKWHLDFIKQCPSHIEMTGRKLCPFGHEGQRLGFLSL